MIADESLCPLTKVPPKGQLLKWIGNKHRSASVIASLLPNSYHRYIEPFVGGGAVLATMAPDNGLAADTLPPLIQLWQQIQQDPAVVATYYRDFWERFVQDRQNTYYTTLDNYNANPNAMDLLCLCRSCYGGVVRFTKQGKMSTPIGPHKPIPPEAFESRLTDWCARIRNTTFHRRGFDDTIAESGPDDMVYCDPPYNYAQAILYGAQSFELQALWEAIEGAVSRGAKVALSIDGHKRSGLLNLTLAVPHGLFKREFLVPKGGSMLKRFQRRDGNVEDEQVADRLLLSW